MKVYVVMRDTPSSYVEGIYSSGQRAERAIAAAAPHSSEWYIEVHPLDPGLSVQHFGAHELLRALEGRA